MTVRTAALAARLGLAAVAGLVLQAFVQTAVPASGTASASSGVAAVDDRSASVVTKRGDGTLVRSAVRSGQDRLAAFDAPNLVLVVAVPQWDIARTIGTIAERSAMPVAIHARPQPRAPPAA